MKTRKLFIAAHFLLATWFIGTFVFNVGANIHALFGWSLVFYAIAIVMSSNSSEELPEMPKSSVALRPDKEITGLIIWRCSWDHRVHYWCTLKKEFVLDSEITFGDTLHNMCDYKEAEKKAQYIQQSGMLYFLYNDDQFPKHDSLTKG